jgi:hypothetical protein
MIGELANENSTFDRLREYPFDGIFKSLHLFRDVGLDRLHKGVDILYRGYQLDQILVSGDLISNNLIIQ